MYTDLTPPGKKFSAINEKEPSFEAEATELPKRQMLGSGFMYRKKLLAKKAIAD